MSREGWFNYKSSRTGGRVDLPLRVRAPRGEGGRKVLLQCVIQWNLDSMKWGLGKSVRYIEGSLYSGNSGFIEPL